MTFLIDAFKQAVASVLDTTSFSAEDAQSGVTSEACAELNADGSATLFGSVSTSPSSPRWWTTTPPATWVSYSSTGTGDITGGLTAGTRYQLNTVRKFGIQRAVLGVANRTFTLSYYDASTGGTLLGTKTFVATAEFA